MVKKSEGRKEELKEESAEKKDISKTWVDSYAAVSKMWEDSYLKLYKPWIESNKETLEKFLSSAEGYNKIYKSWIAELEENSWKTKEILQGEQDPAKYKECHGMWIKSYEKIFDELMELPAQESTKEIFGNYMIIPDISSESFLQMSKMLVRSDSR